MSVAAIDNIDLPLLKQQKQALLQLIWDEPDNILWGVVHLLDAVEDELEKKHE